jgi:HSP20 family protein
MLYRTSLSAPAFGLRREIDRLFEDAFSRGDGMNNWNPAVDVSESDNEVRLELELPGIRPEDVEITADNNVLTVRGEKRGERKEGNEDSRYHLVERSYGSFMRSFQLPQGLDESKIEAECNNGILSIHIPKAALPQPRRIQIGGQSSTKGNAQVSSGTTSSTGNGNSGGHGNSAGNGNGGSGNSAQTGMSATENQSQKKSQQSGQKMSQKTGQQPQEAAR